MASRLKLIWRAVLATTISRICLAADPNLPFAIFGTPSNWIRNRRKLTFGWASHCARRTTTPTRARLSRNRWNSIPPASGPNNNSRRRPPNEARLDRRGDPGDFARPLFPISRTHLAAIRHADLCADPGTSVGPDSAWKGPDRPASARGLHALR